MENNINEIKNGWTNTTKFRRKLIALVSNVFGLLLLFVLLMGINVGYFVVFQLLGFGGDSSFVFQQLSFVGDIFIAFQQIIWFCVFAYFHLKVSRIW
jgi:hypothetical protein